MNNLKDIKPLFGVRTCATSANLGPGYDIAALALDIYNEYRVYAGKSNGTGNNSRHSIRFTGPYASVLDKEKSSSKLLQRAIEITLGKFPDRIKDKEKNLEDKHYFDIEVIANIPPGKGLGSSASAVVAGILIANKVYGLDLNKRQLFQTAIGIESSPDNSAAALSGGLAIVYRSKEGLLFEKVRLSKEFIILLMVPPSETGTDTARKLIPKKVPIEDAIENISNFSLLVKSLEEENLDDATIFIRDNLHQKYRKDLYPQSAGLVADLIDNWQIPAAISGSGPSVIAIMDRDRFKEYKSKRGKMTGKYLAFKSIITSISDRGSYYI
ncbi:MAG: homoserine kinase [Actinobacteria bacterium]|jgi:homoserine kinase|nr:homoserine kinase [Actinomycetota bacterium]